MDNRGRTISDLESQIQYFKKLLDENGISYDYEAHLRALQFCNLNCQICENFT